MLDGVAHYFSPWYIRDDDQRAEIPQDFYLTDAITDRAIRMLEETAKSDQPFFMYLAHHAPHWPLHALPEDIERYAGTYVDGWEKLRGARYEEMRHPRHPAASVATVAARCRGGRLERQSAQTLGSATDGGLLPRRSIAWISRSGVSCRR